MFEAISAFEGLRVVWESNNNCGVNHGREGLVGTVVDALRLFQKEEMYTRTAIDYILRKYLREKMSEASGIIQRNAKTNVTVLWDSGEIHDYRIDEASELRVLDNSTMGVKHQIFCNNCGVEEIHGLRWQCVKCLVNICTFCLTNQKHTASHTSFKRFDFPNSLPVDVNLNLTKSKVALTGFFSGSKVARGPDWYYGDEDGGSCGEVLDSNVSPGKVIVKWYDNKETHIYRVGFQGRVDLCIEKTAIGGYYYPESLPVLTNSYWKESFQTSLQIKNELIKQERTFTAKDKVKLTCQADLLRDIQDGYGGWEPQMKKCIGADGIVEKVTPNGVEVYFPKLEKKWKLNPKALEKLAPFSIGEIVRIRNDNDAIKKLEIDYGEKMAENLKGQVGRVVKISDDGSDVHLLIQKEDLFQKRILESGLVVSISSDLSTKKILSEISWMVGRILEGSSGLSAKLLIQNIWFDVDSIVGDHGVSALHVASKNGNLDAIELLLNRGASLEREDDHGNRAVHHAVMSNQVHVLELLISKKAHIDCVNQNKQTPFHLAASGWFPDCLNVLINNMLLFDINSQDYEGNTALHLAIVKVGMNMDKECSSHFHHVIEKMVLLPSVKFSLTNKQGRTVLHTAAEIGNLCALKCLLNIKSDSMFLDDKYRSKGPTSLYLASEAGHYEVLKCLLEFDKTISRDDVNLLDDRPLAILHRRPTQKLYLPLAGAIKRDHYSIIELLIESGKFNIQAYERNGDTAIKIAVHRIGFAHKIPDVSAPSILKIYNYLKIRLPEKAEPALAVVSFLMTRGAKVEKEIIQRIKDKEIIKNLFQCSRIHQILASESREFRKHTLSGLRKNDKSSIGFHNESDFKITKSVATPTSSTLVIDLTNIEQSILPKNRIENQVLSTSEHCDGRNLKEVQNLFPPVLSDLVTSENKEDSTSFSPSTDEIPNTHDSTTLDAVEDITMSSINLIRKKYLSTHWLMQSQSASTGLNLLADYASAQLDKEGNTNGEENNTDPKQVKWQIETRKEYRGANRTYVKDGLGNTYSQKKGVNVFQCTANVDRNGKMKKCRATVKVEEVDGGKKEFRTLTKHEEHTRKNLNKRQRTTEINCSNTSSVTTTSLVSV